MMRRIRIYRTRFAKYVRPYLRKMTIEGFNIKESARVIESFLNYLKENYGNQNEITKQMIIGWASTSNRDRTPSTNNNYASIVRNFLKFLKVHGERCWYPTSMKDFYQRCQTYVPYIFSETELSAILRVTDSLAYCHSEPLRHLSIPLMFRFLINYGLRESEVCNIKIKDVYPNKIIITDAKNKGFRLIPISDSMKDRLNEYLNKIQPYLSTDCYLFLSALDRRIQPMTLYYTFRKILIKAGIKHRGIGKGPRIIDFRHTFCVMRIRNWLRESKDFNNLIPYLSRFLGHASYSQTAYYFTLVSDLFEDIRILETELYGKLLPKINWEFDYDKEEF